MRSPSRPAALVAGTQKRARKLGTRSGPPMGAVKTWLFGLSCAVRWARSSRTTKGGSPTVRRLARVLGGPKNSLPLIGHCGMPGAAMAWACPPAPPPQLAPGGWMRPLWRSTGGCCRPGNAQSRSWPPGCAGRRSTPPWAPMWWSSSTVRAARGGRPLGPGRSSAAASAPSTVPATAKGGASVAGPTVPAAAAALADPSMVGSGRWSPMPDNVAADPEQRTRGTSLGG
jgi:hypothetical protein